MKVAILDGIDIRIGHFDLGGGEEVGLDFRSVEVGVVEANGLRGVEAVKVNQFAAGGGIHEAGAAAAGEVEHELETVHQDMLFEAGDDLGGWDLQFGRGRLLIGGLSRLIGCLHE